MSEPILADAKLCIDLLEDNDGGGQHSEGLPQEHLQQPRGHQSCRSGFSFFDPGSGNSFGSDLDPVITKGWNHSKNLKCVAIKRGFFLFLSIKFLIKHAKNITDN